MKQRIMGSAVAVVALLAGLAGRVDAAMIDTVNWAADGALDGAGTGTLAGGTILVNYSTIPGAGNASVTVGVNWNASLATNDAVMDGVTNLEGGVFGTSSGAASPLSFVQTVTFSANVTNPILYVNFTDANTTLDFGALSLTLLDSNNAQLAGSIVSFAGSGNGFNDGFAATINGTFGPGTPIQLNFISQGAVSGFDSVAFTIGLAPAVAAVPEPSTLGLLAGVLGLVGVRRRGRLAAAP